MGKKYIVFISLPMSGIPEEEIKKNLFEAKMYYLCHNKIDDRDLVFVDNLDCPNPPQNPDPEILNDARESIWYLSQALVRLSIADEVLFYPGWEKARGCRIERNVCHEFDIPFTDMEEEK